MSRLFISHSSKNDDWVIALHKWLEGRGWSGKDDIFLDLDPERGIGEAWLASKWSGDTTHPLTQGQSPVHIAEAGLKSLKRGLEKAGSAGVILSTNLIGSHGRKGL
jgi:hypothetical protein